MLTFAPALPSQAESQSQTLELELESLQTEVQAAEDAVKAAEAALQEATDEESEINTRCRTSSIT